MVLDCIVSGECCVDLPIRPVPIDRPLQDNKLHRIDPVVIGSGGIVSNAGRVMSALGLNVAGLGCVGDDHWGTHLLETFSQSGMNNDLMIRCEGQVTSATAVIIDPSGEQVFAYHGGASRLLSREMILDRLDVFAQAKVALFGYYGLFGSLENDLPECLAAIRQTGCLTVMDAAGDGGTLSPLDKILPHLDAYFPSEREGLAQTGATEPREMIEKLRHFNTDAIIGIKLGHRGALLSPTNGEWLEIPAITPPGPVLDTTAAGDSFVAGYIAGIVNGLPVLDSARLAAASGACCVTGIGAVAGIRNLAETKVLAGLE